MNRKVVFGALIVVIAGAVAFLVLRRTQPPPPSPSRPLAEVTLRQEWFPNSNYAGALAGAREFARDHKIRLKVLPGSDTVDPIKTVLAGAEMFGDAGADKVLLANSKGADLVVIGVLNPVSPTCFVTKERSGIRVPKDFEGRKVGVLAGTATEYVYKTLVKRAGVDTTKVREVDAPFELTTFIATDAYDVRPAFIYDEPVTLDEKGIRYRIIDPRSYGVEFLGTVYFTRRETIQKHPELVRAFIFTVADGWRLAATYPERAIVYLKEYDPQISEKRELAALKKSLDYFKGDDKKMLYASLDRWQEMARNLKDLKLISDVDLLRTIDYSFVEEYARTAEK